MDTKYLTIVLLENIRFEELITKIERVFHISLPFKNEKGRLVAKVETKYFTIKVIDRYDDLSELLCDEHHILELTFQHNFPLDYVENENHIKKILKNSIKWEYGIWSPVKIGEPYRRIFPNKQTEVS
jgi:hypothetical protein